MMTKDQVIETQAIIINAQRNVISYFVNNSQAGELIQKELKRIEEVNELNHLYEKEG